MKAVAPRTVAGWLVLAGVALALNAVWELAQRPLYDDSGSVLHCLRAAVADSAWTLAAGGAAAAAAHRWDRSAFVPLIVALLAAIAIGIEVLALSSGRWSYAEAMPTLAGLGLAPAVQLPLLGLLAVLATRWTLRRTVRAPLSPTSPRSRDSTNASAANTSSSDTTSTSSQYET